MAVVVDKSELDLLPPEEALARLYELVERFGRGLTIVEHGAMTPSQRHARETGHLLSFGCCSPFRESSVPRSGALTDACGVAIEHSVIA